MELRDIKTRVENALREFIATDAYLLTHDLNERCIASRIAFHLQQQFPDDSVDVEYNRAGDSPKRLNLPEECANSIDDDGRALIVPDIIVHRRGPEGPNLLGIEVKKANDRRGTDCDRMRIEALKNQLGYTCGALLVCETGHDPRVFIREWL